MKKIKEVIVVEGKDDTAQIKRSVNADTVETNGSAVPQSTLKLIKELAKQRGIIIFTDPDFSGERIRRIVSRAVPNAKHAFITPKQGIPKHRTGSLGVEHASPKVIRHALARAYPSRVNAKPQISKALLVDVNLIGGPGSKLRRRKLCLLLNIGYVNGKQLPKRLRMFGISKHRFQLAVQKLDQEAYYEG